MSNDKKNFTSNKPLDIIIKMWILLESDTGPTKLKVDISKITNLDDLKHILKNEFDLSKDIRPSQILFFNYNDRKEVINKFKIEMLETGDFTFVVNKNSNGTEKEIKNKYQFMKLLSHTEPNESNERVLNLKVQIKGKKEFGDWGLKEVAREIYNSAFDTLDTMQKFDIEEFPKLNQCFTEEEVENFVNQLKEKAFVFNNAVNTNGATEREYISIFMTKAVSHIRKYKDSTTKLRVEVELVGSRGYGNLDYEVDIQDVPELISTAKKLDMEKGVSQNLIQVYTAAEKLLGKRKREQVNSLLPSIMFEAKNVVLYIAQLLQAQADALENNQDKKTRQ
ncbi:hypothetical protein Glove_40g8 [Diversispora epigaea]|uniref:Uncharacterized protein n=1 Tax=Diversispora epigaea TaxID=1348612 RepID=A0A397JHR8_9GLOM|nr:hypothetical protein Glove_40g8 [Diversispora epigaea]